MIFENEFFDSKTFKRIKQLVYADILNLSQFDILKIRLDIALSQDKIQTIKEKLNDTYNIQFENKIDINYQILKYYNEYIKPNESILSMSKGSMTYIILTCIITTFIGVITTTITNELIELIMYLCKHVL